MNKGRAGEYVNNLSGIMSYKSYRPSILPPVPPVVMGEGLVKNLVEAHRALAYFNGLSKEIPDMNIFVSMYVRKEALLSSQIEGTQCTLDDVFDPEQDVNENLDVGDVVNYVKALEYGVERSCTLPLCNRLLREVHAVLLANARGEEKNPGEFRRSQNWIGGAGSTLKNARYIPPNVADMQDAMGAWEQYLHQDEGYDPLVQAALLHYQFETIHPFLDGNGRVGRLFVILYLLVKGVIFTPALYLSYYLKVNRVEYYDRMTRVRESGDYEQWINFFLEAVRAAAVDGAVTIEKLLVLRRKCFKLIDENFSGRQKSTMVKVFGYLQKYPLLDITKTAKEMDLAYNTVATAMRNMERIGIVEQNRKGRRSIYVYAEYLSILKSYT